MDISIRQTLDTTKVPYGVLYNRVYGWSNLAHQQVVEASSRDRLITSWSDLYTASYNFGNSLTYAQFREHLVDYELNHTLPLIAIQYNFGLIDTVQQNPDSLVVDSLATSTDTAQVWAIGNNKLAKFINQQARLVGLYGTEVNQNTDVAIVADNLLLLQNTGNNITRYKIYNDGVLIATLLPNTKQVVQFSKAGNAVLTIVCELNNGELITSTQTLAVAPHKKIRAACGNDYHAFIESAIAFKGYDESVATTTILDYHVYYKYLNTAKTNCGDKITKPIFFLDGFDAGNGRNYEKIYNQYMTTDRKVFAKRGDVAEDLRARGYDLIVVNFPKLGEEIAWNDGTNPNIKVPETVHTASNTIVNRKNRDGGADYIERNAMAFVALVQHVNGLVATNAIGSGFAPEPLVIVGPSMGGQISRYALAYMEKQFVNTTLPVWKHKCRLWVSFDSPHEGANIAICAQQALNHMGDFFGQPAAIDNYNLQLRSPAARQLLIEQLDGLNGSATFHQNYYFGTSNNGFDALNTNGVFGSHGYPLDCRKIALVNGSRDGLEIQAPGTEVAFLRGVDKVGLGTVVLNFHMRFMENTGGINNTFEGYNMSSWPSLPGWHWTNYTNLTFFSPTANLFRSRTYQERDWNYWTLLPPGVPCTALNIAVWTLMYWAPQHFVHDKIFKYRSNFSTKNKNPHGSMDAVPGGMIDIIGQIMHPLDTIAHKNSKVTDMTFTDNACFIPVISSLGFKNSNFKWNKKISDRNLICNNGNETYFDNYYAPAVICNNGNETYFDNYYAPAVNEDHVTITDASYAWTIAELAKGRKGSDCISLCGVDKIVGNDFLCLNTTMTYTLSSFISLGVTSGTVTTWTHSAGLQITPDPLNPNNKVFVTALPTAGQTEWIKAVVQNPCGSEKIEIIKEIHSGAIVYTLTYQKLCPACCNYVAVVKCNNPWASAMYEWSDNGIYNSATASNTHGLYKPGASSSSCGAKVWVRIKDNCFNFTPLFSVFDCNAFKPEPGCLPKKDDDIVNTEFIGQEVSAFPNPSNDVWHVEIPNYLNKQIKMSLYDATGKEILNNEFKNLDKGLIDIDAKNLSPNIYLLKVLIDDRVFHIKLIKK
jgi:Secretion system C-terminal sorting domain